MSISSYILDLNDYSHCNPNKNVGAGGFGSVFKVHLKNNENEIYAAKISNNQAITKREQKQFFAEIEVLMKASHPSILKLIGFSMYDFEKSPYPVIITQFHENGSLFEMLTAEAKGMAPHEWTPTKRFISLLGIAFGMKYLHSQGIIHRDLKPGNVLLDKNFYPLICDFGLSKIFAVDTEHTQSSGFAKGTIVYISPEIIKGEKYTKKVDVYAFSLILYEIVSGKLPVLDCKNEHAYVYQVSHGKRPELDYIRNKKHQKMITTLWDQDPTRRYSFDFIVTFLLMEFNEIKRLYEISETNKKTINPNECPAKIIADNVTNNYFLGYDFGDLEIQEIEDYLSIFGEKDMTNENPDELIRYADDLMKTAEGLRKSDANKPIIFEEASRYYKLAADLQSTIGMQKYGQMLENGKGVGQSFEQAIMYYKKAIKLGHIEAQADLKRAQKRQKSCNIM